MNASELDECNGRTVTKEDGQKARGGCSTVAAEVVGGRSTFVLLQYTCYEEHEVIWRVAESDCGLLQKQTNDGDRMASRSKTSLSQITYYNLSEPNQKRPLTLTLGPLVRKL